MENKAQLVLELLKEARTKEIERVIHNHLDEERRYTTCVSNCAAEIAKMFNYPTIDLKE